MRVVLAALLALTASVEARTLRGLVYADANGDRAPTAGEPGIADAVVAYGVTQFTKTNAQGEFTFEVPDDARSIVWVRVPDGFEPGPMWARDEGKDHVDLAVRPLTAPHRGPLTFVVTADSHVAADQPFFADLADVATDAVALDPRPAFFTILGDVTQNTRGHEFALVGVGLRNLPVPYIPVAGNHDWYDGGAEWFARYGPDNYSFDIDTTHFVVWNMAMSEQDIRSYLGAELALVAPTMTIVALTHAPPSPAVIRTLEELGVDYVLTGHTHTNRVVDHGGLIEIGTEPLMMGGIDFTPAGYRVMTIDRGRLGSYHRSVVEKAVLEVVAPSRGQCVAAREGVLIVATELDAGPASVTARLDCGTEVALRYAGGWSWRTVLPPLAAGAHTMTITARTASESAIRTIGFEVCTPAEQPRTGPDWPQLGGGADHTGAVARELRPPLVTRWTATIGGHGMQGSPVIANGMVYVTASDLGDGAGGGVVAFELASGALRWRAPAPLPIRGGPAVVGDTVVASQIDGTVLGLDARTGAVQWRYELGAGVEARGATVMSSPAADSGDVLIGNQRRLAAISAIGGAALWTRDPVKTSEDFNSLATLAIGDGIAVGTFNREIGGVFAWDRVTGQLLWHLDGALSQAINASPVIADGLVYLVTGATEVVALELATGTRRWMTKLDFQGFDWGLATIGTPAIAHGILVVPTLYKELVALDAASGLVLWRFAARPGALRTTHYRGKHEAGFQASPVITGHIVWAADTSGQLTALDLVTGAPLWKTDLRVPVFAGLATSGDWLVVASFDGTVRALTTTSRERITPSPARCDVPKPRGCCDAGTSTGSPLLVAVVAAYLRRRRRRASSASAIGTPATPPPALHV